MRLLLFSFWISLSAYGAIPASNNLILPFSKTDYSVVALVKDYAQALGKNVNFDAGFASNKSVVSLHVHKETTFAEFTSLLKSILDSYGYTLIEEKGFEWLMPSRDIRYTALKFYKDSLPPSDDGYAFTFFSLKNPVGSEVARNLRPFLSRYGRVIDFAGGRALILAEKGETTQKMKDVISFMDDEKLFKAILERKPELDSESQLTNEKIVELELKNKILEKKLMELPSTPGSRP